MAKIPKAALRFKSKNRQTRIVFTDGPGAALPEYAGKIFALIGPFEDFTDKTDLQEALVMLLRGYNLEENG